MSRNRTSLQKVGKQNSQESWYSSALSGAIPVLLVLAAWETASRMGMFPGGMFLPPPSLVFRTACDMICSGTLPENLISSFFRVCLGFLLGTSFGLLLGILMGWNERIYLIFNPLVSLLFPIPALGWLPLLIIWVGIGDTLPVLIIFICTFFPILYNTCTGIRTVPVEYIMAAESLGARGWKLLLKIVIPLALPSIFTGLRLEAGMAWRTVVAAEMIAIPSGIGALLMRGESLIRLDIILVCLGVLSVMSLFFEWVFKALEKWLTGKWI